VPTYSYTHGATTTLARIRLCLGDHRGTGAADTVFSDEEIGDLYILAGSISGAVTLALRTRANREAMGCGVAGTADTSERPGACNDCARNYAHDVRLTVDGPTPSGTGLTDADLDEIGN